MHVASVEQMSNVLVPAAKELRDTLAAKAKEYDNVVMVGRTHLQDEGGADFAARLSRGHRPQAALKLGYLSDRAVRPMGAAQGHDPSVGGVGQSAPLTSRWRGGAPRSILSLVSASLCPQCRLFERRDCPPLATTALAHRRCEVHAGWSLR